MRLPDWRSLFAPVVDGRVSFGVLIVRLVAGYAFTFHGAPKMHDPFHWLDRSPQSTILPRMPAVLQALVAVNEAYGGYLLMAGLLTRVVAFIMCCDVGVVVFAVMIPHGHPFVGKGAPFEAPALLLASALAVLAIGPGAISLDALLFGRRRQNRT